MKSYKINLLYLPVLLFILLPWKSAFAKHTENLTILAEPNMVAPLTQIARLYSQQNNVVLSIEFSSAFDLINEIDIGEPADVFISAHPSWVSELRKRGVIDIYNISHIANDSLALVTTKDNDNIKNALLKPNLSIEDGLMILDSSGEEFMVDCEESSLGQYSEKLINNLQLKNIKVFRKLSEDRTSFSNLILQHRNPYALMFMSEAVNSNKIRILAYQKSKNIYYQALVIAGDNMEKAREFIKFLRTKQVKQILQKNGFEG